MTDEVFTREVDRETRSYRNGLLLGLWDIEEGEYAPHPMSYTKIASLSPSALEGYRDALDDSDEPRDEDRYPQAHLTDALVDGLRIACDCEGRVFLVADQIQHVDCPDCQANHDAERGALDDMPEHFDPEETFVP